LSCDFVSSRVPERPFVLASGSPRRSSILRGLDVRFELDPHRIEELEVPGETPEEHVVRLSSEKAGDVAARRSEGTILGADTIVLMDGRIIGKPADAADAERMLAGLQGRTHEVLTGLTIIRASDRSAVSGYERTSVTFRELRPDEIAAYVANGEPMDKAGSYAIQDCGAGLVRRVEGCFYNVVGLPVVRMLELLDELSGGRP
jgi:septum formation protein